MKLALILLALIGSTFSLPSLVKEIWGFQEIKADDLRVPLDQLLANIDLVELDRVLTEILFGTDQGAFVVLYLRGKSFGRILDTLEGEAEIQNVFDYIEQNGIPELREFIAKIISDLGIPRSPPEVKRVKPMATFEELLQQLAACFDLDGLLVTGVNVLNNDPAVFNLLNYLTRPQVGETWRRVIVQEDVVAFLKVLGAVGLDVDTFIFIIEAFFGWGA